MIFNESDGGWRHRRTLFILLLVIGLHGAGVLEWPSLRPPAVPAGAAGAMPDQPHQDITYLVPLMPAPTPTTAALSFALPPAALPPPPQLPMLSPALAPLAPPPVVSGKTSAEPAPAPLAITAASAMRPGIAEQALNSAAAVDRALRKESWNPRDKVIAQDDSHFSASMAAAYVGAGAQTTEVVTLPDGRRMARIHGPLGTICAQMQSNGLVGGRDVFKDGVKTQVSSCP